MQEYPTQYLREKLAIAQGLVAAGSSLVSQNPAGWLRKAIEKDYTLPKTAERHRQRSGREKKHAKLAQAKSREQHPPEEEPQPAQTVATEPEQTVTTQPPEWQQTVSTQWKQNGATHNRENNTEKKLPDKTSRENQAIWTKTLEQLKETQPREDVEARLSGTTLLEVTEIAARIGVNNPSALPWLERRLYGQIAKAIKGVVGKDLDLQFIAVS